MPRHEYHVHEASAAEPCGHGPGSAALRDRGPPQREVFIPRDPPAEAGDTAPAPEPVSRGPASKVL